MPFVIVYAIFVWFAVGLWQAELWIPFVGMALTTYLLLLLNNQNALIRTYSRMVSCSYLVLTTLSIPLFSFPSDAIIGLCFACCYLLLFQAYQDRSARGRVFYAFASIGIASILSVQLLFLVPAFWLITVVFIQAKNWRTFWASFLGLLIPYWFLACYDFYIGQPEALIVHFERLTEFQPLFDGTAIGTKEMITFGYICLLALIGGGHFLYTSHLDKIRTRMFYELFITMTFLLCVLIVLQPQYFHTLLPLLLINVSPLIAHYITLSRTKISNIIFIILVLLALAITIYNLWIPSLIF